VDKIATEVRSGLMFNQTVNYSGIEMGVGRLMENIYLQSRQQALVALSASTGELQRVAALLTDSGLARSVMLVFLTRGQEPIKTYVPPVDSPQFTGANPESRLAMAMLRLSVQDDEASRAALANALRDEDKTVFAARIALAIKQPALRQVIIESAAVPPLSLAGHLVRQLSLLENTTANQKRPQQP
jgi:hypothetical protein